jgi:hypothetical protein
VELAVMGNPLIGGPGRVGGVVTFR